MGSDDQSNAVLDAVTNNGADTGVKLTAAQAAAALGRDSGAVIATVAPDQSGNARMIPIIQNFEAVVSNDGGSLITSDGVSLVSHDGGTLVATGGGNIAGVLANDGATFRLVATGGGNIAGILANDGASLVSHDGGTFELVSHDGGTLEIANFLQMFPSIQSAVTVTVNNSDYPSFISSLSADDLKSANSVDGGFVLESDGSIVAFVDKLGKFSNLIGDNGSGLIGDNGSG